MEPRESLTTITNAVFEDYEQFAEATQGWTFDFRQLDPGESRSRIVQVKSPEINVMRVGLSRCYAQAGASPPGVVSVGLVEQNVRGALVRGREVTPDRLQTVAAGMDFDGLSQPGFDAYIMMFREESLAEAAARAEVPDLGELLGERESQRAHPDRVQEVRSLLRGLVRAAEAGAVSSSSSIADALSELPERIVLTLAGSSPTKPLGPPSFRDRARSDAVGWIEAHLADAPSVADTCAAIGVSRRTLEYAFREHYGVSPKAYIRALRLTAVREELRRAGPRERVVDVANRFGFWHMGEFAAAYRRHFVELPSTTLKRDSAFACGLVAR